MRLRGYIFAASAAVGLVFLGGSWLAVSQGFDTALRSYADTQAQQAARLTYTTLSELMSRGWIPDEADRFLQTLRNDPSGAQVEIYPAPEVASNRHEAAPTPDAAVLAVLRTGQRSRLESDGQLRSIFPLVAEARCTTCHRGAWPGTVLGAVEVRQPLGQILNKARYGFYVSAFPSLLLGIAIAIGAVWWVSRRIGRSVSRVERSLESVGRIDDLKQLGVDTGPREFEEIRRIHQAIGTLASRLRSIAVDKDILLFEINLLERFVITSDVIRDWREHVAQLLVDINTVLEAHVLFSVFQTEDELFDIEIFWFGQPDAPTRRMVEAQIRDALQHHPRFAEPATVEIHHHASADRQVPVAIGAEELTLRVKSFFVEQPKIGGIVGVGVHTDDVMDQTHQLVLDSILSTLLNVVGSIKAIHKYTRDLEYYATRDPLTHLYNQRVFWELLGYEIGRSARHNAKFALLLLDLDNFKLVNDHYGHTMGDRFLQRFAEAVRGELRNGDIMARYGGDEFVVILPEADVAQAFSAAERILARARSVSVEAPDGERVCGTVSIGLSVYPDHATESKDLFLFADNMMYRAKDQGKERIGVPSSEDVMAVFRDISEMGVAVLAAIDERRIIPFFQPIMDVKSGRIAAVEVLSRMELNGQLMRADQFIEIAEKVGAIHRLDAIVIEAALTQLQASDYDGYIFFNLSPRALVLSEFVHTLRALVKRSGIAPNRIVFEITERDTVKNLSLLERFINNLKAEGFGLAIDDFGSGFSSFHYLRRFPFDFLKIEGDFISNMLKSERDRIFVQNITALARQLNIQVVAEFVESADILDELRQLGIEFAQGYHVGRPARAPALELAPVRVADSPA
ncbi:bifunctional diguanylate cyclase/phosphodiesterase [Nitrogeniibacter mangrovi]|uniref:Bifunctional diguanylate cyclase/phosphodiesterase n=1 Tax=Nitrogeniibacter mangrovi TaxID=2016596 RepID=A0A6C1B6J2_9RHOO|nr:bifunctional diguanylate cyclase/phosphodiesterase [Nitrogeniibacter mangrovi]QID18659.1 bifunctional diguanylate cyclase/phosphodiesterase [Nitrogeniibacter mangrovi]